MLVFRGSFGDIIDINVFATDMYGTFLTDANDYDRQRFAHVFEGLQAQGKRFVAISGNQYDQIKRFFKDYAHQITIVSENGAYINQGALGLFLRSKT